MSSKLIVISGPSGVGKGSVVKEILAEHSDFVVSVSATTRSPRAGEINGREYHFLSEEEFRAGIENGEMLEYAIVHGSNLYGTPKQPVLNQLAQGHSVILEIDIQGAQQVKANYPDAITVFIAPPSMDELARRLAGRGTETESEQSIRLVTAEQEMESRDRFDFVIVNNDVRECAAEVVKLMLR